MEDHTTTPNPIDIHVGSRVRIRRKLQGYSQSDLAEALNLTFQQVQKYERGANRISASKLYEIGKFLAVPVAYFFEDYLGRNGESDPPLASPDIHPFPNGNGRWSRHMADILIKALGQGAFTWGRSALRTADQTRADYIAALKAADQHDFEALIAFARS